MKVYNLTLIINNQVENTILDVEPIEGNILLRNGKEYKMVKVIPINSVSDNVRDIAYYTCVCEDISNNDKRIGVTQVKIIADANIDDLTNDINQFLYENRHKLEILSVDYNDCVCMIKYEQRMTKDIKKSISLEETRIRFELTEK